MIHSADYIIRKGKKGIPFIICGVIVSGKNIEMLKEDKYYLARALALKDIKKSEADSYEIVDIKLIKEVKGL